MAVDNDTTDREAFDRDIRRQNLLGYWMIPTRSDGFREPKPSYGPFLWDWATLHRSLHEAVGHVPKEEAHRRFIGFQHPDLKMGTVPNVILGGQLITAGEIAPPHRHTMDAIRFVVEGDGKAATVVEGEEFPMHKWELITTPNWSWHEHIGFSEPYQQPHQPITAAKNWSRQQFGALQPRTSRYSTSARRPPYRYAWEDTERMLDELSAAPGDPFDDVVVRYADPLSGGPTLLTVDCEIERLRPGWSGKRHRHTHAVVYHVLQGSGVSQVGETRLEWHAGDTFIVPLWTWHAHENKSGEPAVLFSINDRPVMASLGFDREEAAG